MFLFNLGECALLIEGIIRQLMEGSLKVIHKHDQKHQKYVRK